MKKFLISISLVLVSLTALLFEGCAFYNEYYNMYEDPQDYAKVENRFIYVLVGENGYIAGGINNRPVCATIIGYLGAHSGETIDEIVIPDKLGGYPVKAIGYSHTKYYFGPYEYEGIYGENIKKVVINHEIDIPWYGLENFKGNLIINTSIDLDSKYLFNCYIEINVETTNVIISGDEYETYLSDYEQYIKNYHPNSNRFIKNVKFDSVGGQQKTYAAVTQIGVLKEPEVPTKEGFTFDGWYTDEQYGTKWNFEEDKVTNKMTLYAKWI